MHFVKKGNKYLHTLITFDMEHTFLDLSVLSMKKIELNLIEYEKGS